MAFEKKPATCEARTPDLHTWLTTSLQCYRFRHHGAPYCWQLFTIHLMFLERKHKGMLKSGLELMTHAQNDDNQAPLPSSPFGSRNIVHNYDMY